MTWLCTGILSQALGLGVRVLGESEKRVHADVLRRADADLHGRDLTSPAAMYD